MLAKRIIPCLDVKAGRTVKGVHFEDLIDAGDPVELAEFYVRQGADELVFLDITATQEKRKTLMELVKRVSGQINIPFTVGGGISKLEDVSDLLLAGADKVSINSAAARQPDLIDSLAGKFGSQCVVVAIDAALVNGTWQVFLDGGRVATKRNLFDWAREAQSRGAGEILFTSMNHDGAKRGFAISPLQELNAQLQIPVVASGGAGTMAHFADVFRIAYADAALAASVFHFRQIAIPALKFFLSQQNIPIRL